MNFKKLKTEKHTSAQASYSVSDKSADLTLPSVQEFKEKLEKINPMAGWLKNFSKIQTAPVFERAIPELHHISFCYKDNVDLFSENCQQHFMQYFESLYISA